MNRPTLSNLNAGQKLRDTENGNTYRVLHVCRETPSVKVATPEGSRELSASEFLRMEFVG